MPPRDEAIPPDSSQTNTPLPLLLPPRPTCTLVRVRKQKHLLSKHQECALGYDSAPRAHRDSLLHHVRGIPLHWSRGCASSLYPTDPPAASIAPRLPGNLTVSLRCAIAILFLEERARGRAKAVIVSCSSAPIAWRACKEAAPEQLALPATHAPFWPAFSVVNCQVPKSPIDAPHSNQETPVRGIL